MSGPAHRMVGGRLGALCPICYSGQAIGPKASASGLEVLFPPAGRPRSSEGGGTPPPPQLLARSSSSPGSPRSQCALRMYLEVELTQLALRGTTVTSTDRTLGPDPREVPVLTHQHPGANLPGAEQLPLGSSLLSPPLLWGRAWSLCKDTHLLGPHPQETRSPEEGSEPSPPPVAGSTSLS